MKTIIIKIGNKIIFEFIITNKNEYIITSAKIGKELGDEIGWINSKSNLINQRFSILIGNKNTYIRNQKIENSDVLKNLEILLNNSDNLLNGIRKIITILTGANATSGKNIFVEFPENGKKITLNEWLK